MQQRGRRGGGKRAEQRDRRADPPGLARLDACSSSRSNRVDALELAGVLEPPRRRPELRHREPCAGTGAAFGHRARYRGTFPRTVPCSKQGPLGRYVQHADPEAGLFRICLPRTIRLMSGLPPAVRRPFHLAPGLVSSVEKYETQGPSSLCPADQRPVGSIKAETVAPEDRSNSLGPGAADRRPGSHSCRRHTVRTGR